MRLLYFNIGAGYTAVVERLSRAGLATMLIAALALAACGGVGQPSAAPSATESTLNTAPAITPALANTQYALQVTAPEPDHTSTPAPPTPTVPVPTPTTASLLNLPAGQALELVRRFTVPRTGFGVDLDFSAVGELLFHSGVGGRIQEVPVEGAAAPREFLAPSADYMLALAVSPEGRYLAANDGANVQIWDLVSGNPEVQLRLAPVSVLYLGFLQGGWLYGADTAGNVALWEQGSWQEVARVRYGSLTEAVFILEDPQRIILQLHDSDTAVMIDFEGQVLGELKLEGSDPRLISVSPDGTQLLVYANRGYGAEGATLVEFPSGQAQQLFPLRNLNVLTVSPRWSLLAAVTSSDVLRIFRLPDGELLLTQMLDLYRVRKLSISPDDRYLATHSLTTDNRLGLIQLWARSER